MKLIKNKFIHFTMLILFSILSMSFLSNSIYFGIGNPSLSQLNEAYRSNSNYIRLSKKSYNVSFIAGLYSQYESFNGSEVSIVESFNDESSILCDSFDYKNFLYKDEKADGAINLRSFAYSAYNTKAIYIDSSRESHKEIFETMTSDSRLPEKDNEIAITDTLYEYITHFGCIPYGSNSLIKPASPSEAIGMNVAGYTITGVFSTPESEMLNANNKEILYSTNAELLKNKNIHFADQFILPISAIAKRTNQTNNSYIVKLTGNKTADAFFLSRLDGLSVPPIGIGITSAYIDINGYSTGRISNFYNSSIAPAVVGIILYIAYLVAFGFYNREILKDPNNYADKNKHKKLARYFIDNKMPLILIGATILVSILVPVISYSIANGILGYINYSFDIRVALISLFLTLIPMIIVNIANNFERKKISEVKSEGSPSKLELEKN